MPLLQGIPLDHAGPQLSLEVIESEFDLVVCDLCLTEEDQVRCATKRVANRNLQGWLEGPMSLPDEVPGHRQLAAVSQRRPLGRIALERNSQPDREPNGAKRVQVHAGIAAQHALNRGGRDARSVGCLVDRHGQRRTSGLDVRANRGRHARGVEACCR